MLLEQEFKCDFDFLSLNVKMSVAEPTQSHTLVCFLLFIYLFNPVLAEVLTSIHFISHADKHDDSKEVIWKNITLYISDSF